MSAIDRARAYLQKLPPAIQGQAGSASTFRAACVLVGFGLTWKDAWPLLSEWNATHCRPCWTEVELKHKLTDAFKTARPNPKFCDQTECSSRSGDDKAFKRSKWPPFERPTSEQIRIIAQQRNVGREGLELAVDRGLLWTATFKGHPCWIVSDSTRLNAQARRLDGEMFPVPNEEPSKVWTLLGSVGSQPIGLSQAMKYPNVILVEGGPDLLAAFHYIYIEGRAGDCCAISILGAGNKLSESSLPAFKSTRVRLFPHVDLEGMRAGVRWAQSLRDYVSHLDRFRFKGFHRTDGQPVNDLNDLCYVDPDEFEACRRLWSLCPSP